MNKATLVEKIAKDARITKTCAANVVESLIEGIASALQNNQRVTLSGFGTWNVSQRKARRGRNPRTGEPIQIDAKKSVRFKSGKQLETSLNNS